MLYVLIDKGLVKLGDFTAEKVKRRYTYILTPKGIARKAALKRAFPARKMEGYETLREEIEALKLDVMSISLRSHPGFLQFFLARPLYEINDEGLALPN